MPTKNLLRFEISYWGLLFGRGGGGGRNFLVHFLGRDISNSMVFLLGF